MATYAISRAHNQRPSAALDPVALAHRVRIDVGLVIGSSAVTCARVS